MAKVGLKETLALLAAGYKKKDIEALAEIDAELESTAEEEVPAPAPVPEQPKNEKQENDEPDYKALYEELKKKNEESQAKITKLQQDNIHADSAPALEDQMKQEQEDLLKMVRTFM